jgi:hypothetical protein
MYQEQTEDFRQVLSFRSVDAALHRAASWGKLCKSLQRCKMPTDFWTAVKKGMQAYIADPKKAKDRVLPYPPFPVTLNRERNALKSAYHAQSKIGWENLLKGRIAQEWTQFIETHCTNQGHTLNAQDWAPRFIGALWEHTQRVWKFKNVIYHAGHNGRTSRYKQEEQQR